MFLLLPESDALTPYRPQLSGKDSQGFFARPSNHALCDVRRRDNTGLRLS